MKNFATACLPAPAQNKLINDCKQKSKKKSPLFYLVVAFFLLHCFQFNAQNPICLFDEAYNASPPSVSIDLAKYPSGLYLLQFKSIRGDIHIEKVILQ